MHPFFKRCLDLFTPITTPDDPVPPIQEKNEVEELLDGWLNLDASKANHVFSSNKSILMVGVRKKNIEDYLNYLDMVLMNFRNNTTVIPSITNLPSEVTYLRTFFFSKQGHFLDASEKVSQLKEKVIEFLNYYNKATSDPEETEERKKSIHYTLTLVGELRQLLEVLEP